eukprot:GFUD01017532.1.p1 GENE.GFUD01017532.1~~GFUD01017532.1.p1  ORF type:complete len:397 (-),score=93.07 GFUD01017532.1:163-1353(-)
MEEAWIWYGPPDPVSLCDIKNTGAKAISTALYEIPAGEVWPLKHILERKCLIEAAGFTWSVVESIPVHEVIKIGEPHDLWRKYVDNYKESLRNLSRAGLDLLSYSFMPLFDWLRTDTDYLWHDGSRALRFSMDAFRVFDIHILKRTGATADYSSKEVERAAKSYSTMTREEVDKLSRTLVAGLHGQKGYSLDSFRCELARWKGVTKEKLFSNLKQFVGELTEVAEQENLLLSLHPDDPPMSLMGLPSVASTEDDFDKLFSSLPSPCNGITFCMGSLASNWENDVLAMARRFKSRVHFVHLRNVIKTDDGGLVESGHLEGDADLVGVMDILIKEKEERKSRGNIGAQVRLPMRSDHGHLMLSDMGQEGVLPGHSVIGRLRGLAEIRGVQAVLGRGNM